MRSSDPDPARASSDSRGLVAAGAPISPGRTVVRSVSGVGRLADSVIGWLAAHGVDKARLVPAGFGDTRPIADNQSDDGRQKNRRVDLVKLY